MAEQFADYNLDVTNDGFTVIRLADGLGFGDGSISRIKREAMPGNEDLAVLTDLAMRESGIVVPVGRYDNGKLLDDDGCIDGRGLVDAHGAVFSASQTYKTSLHRPKVAGGGIVMATATRIGLGLDGGQPLKRRFSNAIKQANAHDLKAGAHMDDYAHGEDCGCGAIDKAMDHLQATQLYRPDIAETIQVLVGHAPELHVGKQGENQPGILDYYKSAAEDAKEVKDFAGSIVLKNILGAGAVTKLLSGPHMETRIAWNRIEDHTIDQSLVRDMTDGRAQTFVVDEWRMKRIAETLYKDPEDQHRAFLSQIVYTLGVAAVLTKGDLAIDLYEAA